MPASSPFARGVFTLSLDFELVWGSRDLSPDPAALIAMALVTRDVVFPALLGRLVELGMTATWATVGHLFLDQATRVHGVLHPDVVPPRHPWRKTPWFDGVPEGTELEHPAFYGQSLVTRLRDSGQDIGSHSFSHPIFGAEGCSRASAVSDLTRSVAEAAALGISMKSFVFPRNVVGHIDLLRRLGFTCWRGPEPVWYRSPYVPEVLSRLGHLYDVARVGLQPTVLPYKDAYGLWCIPASGSFLPIDGVRRAIPMSSRVERNLRCLDRAAATREVCHLWSHPINLASAPEAMLAGFGDVFDHAARLRDRGLLDVLSMAEVAATAEAAA